MQLVLGGTPFLGFHWCFVALSCFFFVCLFIFNTFTPTSRIDWESQKESGISGCVLHEVSLLLNMLHA